MQEIVKEVTTTFGIAFLKSYKCNLIEQVKEEQAAKGGKTARKRTKSFHIAGDAGQEYQLVPPPPATAVIKVGTLTKRGDLRKKWTKRWFVALNEANNYDIKYYTEEPDMSEFEPDGEGKVTPPKKGLKGSMRLAGYKTSTLDSQEHGILIKGNDSQRPWLIRAESAEDAAEWIPVFQRAAKEASPPQHEDPVIHAAFMDAYKAVRHSQGLWGSWDVWGAEGDMLAWLCQEVLHEKVLAEIYDAVPKGPMKDTMIGIIKKTSNGIVRAGAGAAWKATCLSLSAVKGPLNTAAKSVIQPIVAQEPKIIAKVTEKIGGLIKSPIEKLTGEVAKKIFDVMLDPVAKFYVGAVKGFTKVMNEHSGKLGSEPDKALHVLSVAVWGHGNNSMLKAGGCWAADEALRGLTSLDALAPILGGKTASSIAFLTTRSVAMLLEKAIFDVQVQVETGIGAIPAIATTTGKLVNDCQLTLETFCLEMLGGIIIEPVGEQVKPLIEGPIEPINEMIHEAVKDFLDLQRIAEAVIDETLVTALKAVVCPALVSRQQAIADAGNP
jgi:hypothetical protein